jgi:hypothetical protein
MQYWHQIRKKRRKRKKNSLSVPAGSIKEIKMRCPECEMNTNSVGKMKKFRRGIPSRGYGTCKVCRYVVSEDFVSGQVLNIWKKRIRKIKNVYFTWYIRVCNTIFNTNNISCCFGNNR